MSEVYAFIISLKMTKLIIFIWIFAAFIMPSYLFSQVTYGSIEIEQDVELISDSIRGQKGIIVEVRDLVVRGYEGRFLTIAVQIYKDSPRFMPVDYMMTSADSDNFEIEELRFEITNIAMHRYLGAGPHDVYLVFSVNAQIESELELLPGGYFAEPITVQMPNEPPVDIFAVEKRKADETLSKLAKSNPFYNEVLEFSNKYNLIIGIRDFDLGNQNTDPYDWQFCTDDDNAVLERNLSSLINNWNLPRDFIELTELKAIVFVKGVSFNGLEVGGGADQNGRFVLFRLDPNSADEWVLHVIYHEYMHYIDNVMYSSKLFDADRWRSLNAPGRGYSYKGALDMIEDNYDYISEPHPEPGFLNGYCTADIYQDKAEVFACILIPSWYERVKPWLKDDPYLAAKFDFMKKAMKAMSPQLSEQFFDRLHE